MPESTMSVRDSLKFQNKCFPKDNSLKDSNLLSLRGNLQGKGYIPVLYRWISADRNLSNRLTSESLAGHESSDIQLSTEHNRRMGLKARTRSKL